ncbi:MAG: hypothetical protein PHQ43_11960 [Dehalococcoidales bacterium]|nr:hypothetical protein [Dehalococcoidales bacterium]
MADKERDSWDLDSGLPDDFDFHITGAAFGYRQEYMDGEVPLLIWEGESPDEDVASIIWPCGQGWEVVKGGAEVQHPKRNRFVKTSMMGKLISRVVSELGVDMRNRGPATKADVWKGLGFHLKREEIEYGSGILEDRGGKTTHLMPVAVLDKATKAKAKPTAEAPEIKAEKPSNELTMKKLTALATKLSREEWQKKAMDMPEVVENDELLGRVLDDSEEGLYHELKNK